MKHTLFVSLTLFSLPLVAQKVDLDAEPLSVHYTSLPLKPFPAEYQTYSATLSANPSDLPAIGLSERFFTDNLKVSGFKKVKEGGNFNLELNMSDYRQAGGESKTNVTQQKDRSGKMMEVKTYYYVANYEHALTLRVKDQEGKKVDERTWLYGTRTFKSREFNTTADLNDYLRASLGRDIAVDDQKGMTAAMKEIYQYLNTQFGYYDAAEKPVLWILDSEKHPDYPGFQQALSTARSALATMKADQPLDSVRLLLQPAIAYFDQQKDKYNPEEKAQRKLKYACLFNLSVLHFWIENLDKAAEYANGVIANDYDGKDGKRLLEAVTDLQRSYVNTGKNTRHLKFEFAEDAETQAAEVKYDSNAEERKEDYKRKTLDLSPNTVQYEGWVTGTDGKEKQVLFLVESPRSAGLAFAYNGNVRYAVDMGARYTLSRIDKGKLAAFGFDGRTFRVVQYRTANAVNIGNTKVIMEVLYESPKYNAFLAFTGDNEALNNPPEYVIQQVSDLAFTSLNGLKFALNLNKGIKKVYESCPAAVEAADKEGFKRNADDIIRLVKMLEACAQ